MKRLTTLVSTRPLTISLLICLAGLGLAQPFVEMAQTNTPVLLSPAQEAVDKGIIAAKVPDYLLAIRFWRVSERLSRCTQRGSGERTIECAGSDKPE